MKPPPIPKREMERRLLTQAEVERAVRGAIRAHEKAGLPVGEVETTIEDGKIRVKVTAPMDSAREAWSDQGRAREEIAQAVHHRIQAARRASAGP